MDTIPAEFAQRSIDIDGEPARDWVAQLPALLESLADLWSLSLGSPFPPLSYSYLCPVSRQDNTEAVLKLRFPGPGMAREVECLTAFAGDGAVLLLESDVDRGALLLERIRPGSDLSALTDDEAVQQFATVVRRLHKPPPTVSPFPAVADWGQGFERHRTIGEGSSPLPSRLIDAAQAVHGELAGSMDQPVLLHGDLHHGNILAGTRQPWLAIDPQGVVGERAYEIGAFLRNPIDTLSARPDLESLMSRRVSLVSEVMQLDRGRVIGWGMAQAVLAGIWSYEDHGTGWEEWVRIGEALDVLRRSA